MKHKEILSKAVCLTAALALACGLMPLPDVRAGGEDTEPETVEASENQAENAGEPEEILRKVITINTVEDFLEFADNCYVDTWSADKQVLLNADIDLTGAAFDEIPIFAGAFDGKDHRISGFTYNGDGYVAGLFRYIAAGAVVENLTLEGEINASDKQECIGGLCGVNYGTIRNCSFQGNVSGMTDVGGLCGVNYGMGTILDCGVNGRVTGYYSTGGIAGRNHGILSSCSNNTSINNNVEWVEEDDEMGIGIFLSINLEDSGRALVSGMDTGGIAGYSDGVIIGCVNYGTIGYEHTGYNIGGIAGRQCGVVSGCTNHGRVFGRKDVGGIVGQMEPYIEVDEAQSLRNAVNKLHTLIGKTIDDMQTEKNVLKEDFDILAAYSSGAVDAGNALASQMASFVDNNLDQVQSATDRMSQAMKMLPGVFDSVYAAEDSLSGVNEAVLGIVNLLDGMRDIVGSLGTDYDGTLQELAAAIENVNAVINEIRNSQEVNSDQIHRLVEGLERLSGAISALISSMSAVSGQIGQQALENLQNLNNLVRDMVNRLQGALESVKAAGRSARSIVDYLNAQPDIHFSKLGGEFAVSRENLHDQLRGVSSSIKALGDHASVYSDVVNNDLRAINDQLKVIFNLLADSLVNYGELSVEELYEEIDEEDMVDITTGKTADCTNKGIIKGDINVGGIAGAMSIDEEDPEDSAAGNVDFVIGRKYITKCIVIGCINEGFVTAKKDGAGGIVGYMKHGIVADCESYGSIESTEGDYVGGICGESLTEIKRCFALCSVSGGRNIGGIAGFADTLSDCYAMADCNARIGRKGAIAGQTVNYEDSLNEEEMKVSGNYYVSGPLYGIDNISYAGIAEPISYEELLTVEGLPTAFWHLKAIFRVEDVYLGVQEVKFGESLAGLEFPEIPEIQGYYGVWPDYSDQVMTGNLMIDGSYKEIVKVVQSRQVQAVSGDGQWEKPYALVDRYFTEDAVLNVVISDMIPPEQAREKANIIYDISLENAQIDDTDTFAVRLYNPYKNAEVWGCQGGVWTLLDSKERGQYLQVDMTGGQQTFCVADGKSNVWIFVLCGVCGAAVELVMFLFVKLLKSRRKKRTEDTDAAGS